MSGSRGPLLEASRLAISYGNGAGLSQVLRGVDLRIEAGERLAIVGESGSGKTQLLLAALGLLPASARVSGSVRYRGQELVGADVATWNTLRGRRIGMVFQDPMSALNPFLTVERQLTEGPQQHLGLSRRAARARASALLEAVQIPEPLQRLRQYPHELSGGMRQRVLIAMALACEPELLLADEPTTALDVTVQAQVLSLLRELRELRDVAIVLVTHDLGVVAEFAARALVMYAGRIVESAQVEALFADPRHPYTVGLKRAVPALSGPMPERLPAIGGQPPDPTALPQGCAFEPRCRHRLALCANQDPELRAAAPAEHLVACHYEGPL